MGLLAELIRNFLLLFHLFLKELILPLVEILEIALEHLVSLGHLLTGLRDIWPVLACFSLGEEVPLESVGGIFVEAFVDSKLAFGVVLHVG